jgi:hypothetical protein
MVKRLPVKPQLIIPVGTQIVTCMAVKSRDGGPVYPCGAVGVVVQAPADNQHAYRVRFPDGAEATLHRRAFVIRKHFQQDAFNQAEAVLADFDLSDSVIYRRGGHASAGTPGLREG